MKFDQGAQTFAYDCTYHCLQKMDKTLEHQTGLTMLMVKGELDIFA